MWGDDGKPNPGDYSHKVGLDLYLNPYWALKFQAPVARAICDALNQVLGTPRLVFQGLLQWSVCQQQYL